MEISANPKAFAGRYERVLSIGESLLTPKVLLTVYVIAAIGATVSKLVAREIVFNGVLTRQMIPFGVFRFAFFHLIRHQDIYAAFPMEPDIFKYSPAFALFMAPFAALPFSLGATLWNLLNAIAIFAGIWAIPRVGNRGKALILWFIILRVIGNMQNAQSDALVTGLMVGAWAAQEREKPALSSFCIASSVFIKLFGGLALLPCLMVAQAKDRAKAQANERAKSRWRAQWLKLFGYLAMWTAIFAAAPLVVVSPRQLLFLYRSWYARLQVDAATGVGINVEEIVRRWFHLHVPNLYVDLAGAVILLLVFLLRTDAYKEFRFRTLAISSVLIWVVIFNHMAQSTSMLVAVTGVAMWYFLEPPNIFNGVLTSLAFVLTVLFSTAFVPSGLRFLVMRGSLLPYAVPCVLVWLKIQYDLLRFPRQSIDEEAILFSAPGVKALRRES